MRVVVFVGTMRKFRFYLLEPTTVSHDIVLEDFMYIGKYALQFLWSDEHFTGIFPFTVLKNLD